MSVHKDSPLLQVLVAQLALLWHRPPVVAMSIGEIRNGALVDFELHAQDRVRYDATAAGDIFHPDFLPAGFWVSVDNYDKCPIWGDVMDRFDDGSNSYDNVGPGPSIALSRHVILEKLAKSMWFLPAMETTVNFSSTRMTP